MVVHTMSISSHQACNLTAHILQAITHDTSEQNRVWLRETNITGQL